MSAFVRKPGSRAEGKREGDRLKGKGNGKGKGKGGRGRGGRRGRGRGRGRGGGRSGKTKSQNGDGGDGGDDGDDGDDGKTKGNSNNNNNGYRGRGKKRTHHPLPPPPLEPPLTLNDALESAGSSIRVPCEPTSTITLLSGGAPGADSVFDMLLGEADPSAIRIGWSFPTHTEYAADPGSRVVLESDFVGPIALPYLQRAAKALSRRLPKPHSKAMAYFQRNVFQVLWADAVYVLGWLDPKARSAHKIGGGTRWAVQPYLDRFAPTGQEDPAECRLYLYNIVMGETSGVWLQWDHGNQAWDEMETAPPSPLLFPGLVFAGIGSQHIPPHALAAATDLFVVSDV